MNINFDKIAKIYGEEVLFLIKDNLSFVSENISFLSCLGFEESIDIFECFPHLFIEEPTFFKKKVCDFIKILGEDYIEILSTNMDLWEELL